MSDQTFAKLHFDDRVYPMTLAHRPVVGEMIRYGETAPASHLIKVVEHVFGDSALHVYVD